MLGAPKHLPLRDRANRGEMLSPWIYTRGPSFNGSSAPTAEVAVQMVKEQKAAGLRLPQDSSRREARRLRRDGRRCRRGGHSLRRTRSARRRAGARARRPVRDDRSRRRLHRGARARGRRELGDVRAEPDRRARRIADPAAGRGYPHGWRLDRSHRGALRALGRAGRPGDDDHLARNAVRPEGHARWLGGDQEEDAGGWRHACRARALPGRAAASDQGSARRRRWPAARL